jgi:hypothetical protein
MFVLFYSILGGFGMGIGYFLPILCGWSYFPTIRPIVAGAILCWFPLMAMGYARYATLHLNPLNERPPIIISEGLFVQKFYDPNSTQVLAIPELLRNFAFVSITICLIGIPFICINKDVAIPKRNEVLDELQEYLP